MDKFDLIKEIRELKNQLSYSKNMGFFLGAGSSCALGIPDVDGLTNGIEESLGSPFLKHFRILKKDLESTSSDKAINIEGILNHTRLIREITEEKSDKNYLGIDGESAKELDLEICYKIYKLINEKESQANLENTKKFLAWLSMQNRDYSKEIFTTNYDLIIEKSLELNQLPYFDGFVGSYEPFFWQESVEKFVKKSDLTQDWIRLWKVHGSLNWFWKKDEQTNSHKIIRMGNIDSKRGDEIVIYPSKEKYASSRKLPFVAYFDRLRNYLLNGELLFIFTGYSFSDQHINDIVFNCLRQNNRLFALIFAYKDSEVENLYKLSSSYLNLSVFGPTKAIINGTLGGWVFIKKDLKQDEKSDVFWNETDNKLTLGDFSELVKFFIAISRNKETIEAIANET